MRKFILGIILCCFALGIIGCQTTRNTVAGTAYTVYGAGKGMVDDTVDAYNFLVKMDEWVEEHAW